MHLDSLKKLYVHQLKDLYNAENQVLEALPKMAKAASDEELRAAFEKHTEETRGHLGRLEKIFGGLDFEPGGQHCHAAEGLIKEAKELMRANAEEPVLDAALVAAAQRFEHYEMAGYGTARAFAKKLGEHDAVELLTETLDEEAKTDRELTRLAERSINFEAMVAG